MSSNLPKSQPMKLGQKSVKNLVGFLGDLKTPKIHSEINHEPLLVVHGLTDL